MDKTESRNLIKDAFSRHIALAEAGLRDILPDVEKAAEMLLEAAKGGGKILTCGNGGSAADAQHLAGEWVCRYNRDRRPLAAVALTVDTSALTAIGNDYGFEHVFSRQVEALGGARDVLVVFTTSGKSKNVLEAVRAAKEKGLKVLALTGKGGADLKGIADVAVVVPSEEIARIQEVHELIYHAWCEFVDANL